MSYRVAAFFKPAGLSIEEAVRFSSEKCNTPEEASLLLDALVAPAQSPFVGGHIEQHVPNIGWVYLDEVESVIFLNRLRESDKSLVE